MSLNIKFLGLLLSLLVLPGWAIHFRNDISAKKRVSIKSFPNSDSPITGQPPLVRPPTQSCQVQLFQNVSLYYYSEVVSKRFQLPLSACPSDQWNMIVLDVHSFEQGTQYDRIGGIWINDQEVLRTTTPEPTSAGITWSMEKDLTIYGNYFVTENSKKSGLTAYVSIPNNVDSTYTGIIYLNATLTFYLSSDNATSNSSAGEYPAQTLLPLILPLTKAPTTSSDLFSAMQISGSQTLNYYFQLPNASIAASHWQSLLVDIYASAHGCEEFYYSNLPSANASDYGFCGGGIYREIEVYIDSKFAGSISPFPVIYTGGVNPFLWRPLTGIMSFDIPSHRLDLTPFLGYLYDGQDHEISLTVFGNNNAGFWYLDASLILTQNLDTSATLRLEAIGDPPTIFDTGVKLMEKSWISSPSKEKTVDKEDNLRKKKTMAVETTGEISFHTFGSRYYRITGSLIYTNGMTVQHQVQGQQQTINLNSIIGTALTRTIQNTSCVTESSLLLPDGSEYRQSISSYYPLYLEDYYAEDATTFDMQATVAYAYQKRQQWTYLPATKAAPATAGDELLNKLPSGQSFSYELTWNNQMFSNATYNRSVDHSMVFAENDSAIETFDITGRYSTSLIDARRAMSLLTDIPGDYLSFIHRLQAATTVPSTAEENQCFHRLLLAREGSVDFDHMNGTCSLPDGLTICAYDICGLYHSLPLQQIAAPKNLRRTPVDLTKPPSSPASHAAAVRSSRLENDFVSSEKTVRRRRKFSGQPLRPAV